MAEYRIHVYTDPERGSTSVTTAQVVNGQVIAFGPVIHYGGPPIPEVIQGAIEEAAEQVAEHTRRPVPAGGK